MDKIQVTDEFLYQHIPGLEEKLLNALPEEEDIHVEFTEWFNQRMEKLIHRAKQKEQYHVPVTSWGRTAAAIAVVVVGLIVASMNVKAVREKLYDFVETIYSTYDERTYITEGNAAGKFVPLYPKYIPRGYEPAIEDKYEGYLFLSYENKEGTESIVISQEQVINGMTVATDNEYIKEEPYTVRGQNGRICYKDNGTVRVLWETSNTLYLVSGTDVSKEELLKVCESLEEK